MDLGMLKVEHVDLLRDIEQVTSRVSGSASKARSSRHLPHSTFMLINTFMLITLLC